MSDTGKGPWVRVPNLPGSVPLPSHRIVESIEQGDYFTVYHAIVPSQLPLILADQKRLARVVVCVLRSIL